MLLPHAAGLNHAMMMGHHAAAYGPAQAAQAAAWGHAVDPLTAASAQHHMMDPVWNPPTHFVYPIYCMAEKLMTYWLVYYGV